MADYFSDIPVIPFEGPESKNPLAFKFYNANEKVGGKSMKEHLRFSMAYWHTMTGGGVDPFGAATMRRPWDTINDPMQKSKAMMEAAFEIMSKLGIGLYCFHDRDIAPAVESISETNAMLDEIVDVAEGLMKKTGIKLLWGTANMFHHPRFAHGAGTSCSADVFAYAAAQVKKALEVTHRLGGDGYVFWGGREGYETLLNTDMGLELDNLARLLQMAVDYAKEIGFNGQFLIEPKPKEPTKHQYDFDASTVAGFLRKYDLIDSFKLNLETNHATLAGHTFEHDLRFARINGILGSVDANQGDLLLGWDTDQFPTNIYVTTYAMIEILKNGGLGRGGLNFDAKPRRASFEPQDIFLSHIAGMDGFAKGLKTAYAIIESGELDAFVKNRYASFSSGIGKDIVAGSVGLKELEAYAMSHSNGKESDALSSGRQEMLESIVNRYIG